MTVVQATLAAVLGSDGLVARARLGCPAPDPVVIGRDVRGGWNRDAAYLYFDLSTQAIGTPHEDACHFDLYAYGKPLLTDTGDYSGVGLPHGASTTRWSGRRSQARGANA